MNTHIHTTAIRAAFERMTVKASAYTEKGAIIGAKIYDALSGKAGQVKQNDWNAKLSFETAKDLGAPIFNPGYVRTRIDGSKEFISTFHGKAMNTGTYVKMVS